jgi:hypothetical protein
MASTSSSRVAIFVAALTFAVCLAVQTVLAIDVSVGFDKKFDFTKARTWGWNPDGAGDVRMARSVDDDPVAVKKAAEPIIMSAVTSEMAARKLQFSTTAPGVYVTYYLLLSTGANEQIVGQFVPSTVAWSLPLFSTPTQSLEIIDRGSLVLDVSANKMVVWRGAAKAKIKTDEKRERREALLREAVRDLLKKFPPKP